MEYAPEIIASCGIAMVGWYLNRMTNQLDTIHEDMRDIVQRVVKLETMAEVRL